ncbi:unnamed protein product [Sordaria macrospora k-hell]|uniref:WGS project CABT00000000 data, contig 2.8 n=2 Tax=Sordaria macrospora TaxID=5147 RepID=F7VV66_SORMK|nr:uncharacterized protein SMAC_05170 [Sordaria macrospora k-hell]CCC09413.1 unnamed protein product [Sordaria macrospora k-hell]
MVNQLIEDKGQWTLLCLAAENGHEMVVKLLLDTGKVNLHREELQTALWLAERKGYKAIVIIKGNTDIVLTATVLISQLEGTAPITEVAECTLVFDSFREFVRVNQAYLNIMIGKAGILSRTPLAGPPVASTFKEMEKVYDTISITLINLCGSRATGLTSEANSLGNTLDLAVKQYEGLSA